jgi:hypothetical protein
MESSGPAAEEVYNGPLSERLTHKVWKVRLAAYEELTKLFKEALDDRDPVFVDYGKNRELKHGQVVMHSTLRL